MKAITLASACLTLITASSLSHATSLETKTIQSMTIEEIGNSSGGLGTSAAYNLGGEVAAYDLSGALFGGSISGFISMGSADGAIVMGTRQANNAFSLGYIAGGGSGTLNTLRNAPGGSIIGGTLFLDLTGFATDFGGLSFSLSPDNNTLTTAIAAMDSTHYYYTADWSHLVKSGEVFDLTTGVYSTGLNGWTLVGHLEGVAAVPEADTFVMMLMGLSMVGAMVKFKREPS